MHGFGNLPFYGGKLLGVAHDLAKVDVEHVAAVFDHDVVVMTITDAQHKRGDTPASARVQEVHDGLRTREACKLTTSHGAWAYLQVYSVCLPTEHRHFINIQPP